MKKTVSAGVTAFNTDTVNRPWRSVRILRRYFKEHLGRVLLGLLALTVVDLFQLLIPRVIKAAVDELQYGTATRTGLLIHGATIVGLAVLIAGLRFLWRNLLLGFSRIVEADLRERLFSHILKMDMAFYQRRTPGEIMALATNDLSSVQLACGMGFVAFVDAAFMGIAAIAFMAWINPWLALIAVAPMPILAFLTRFLSSRLHKRFSKVQEQFSFLTEFARSSLVSIRLIKAYNQEIPQSERFRRMGETYVRDNLRLAVIYGTLFPISGLIANVSMLLIVVFGGRMAIKGIISAGDLVAFISYLFLMTWPMMAMGWVADLFQRGVTSLGRIHSLLLEEESVEGERTVPGRLGQRGIRGSVQLRHLSFKYKNREQPALSNISLEIRPGSFVGIIGRTGSGKTTLCNLLARLYPVDSGTLFFDGVDVNEIPVSEIREQISYVPQDVTLFSETVSFNISMGKPDASREEIEQVARAASIHEEILAMPLGYQTMIGEKGVKLSGGQRQRIAIARALLNPRPIIIIDDALSAVDMETEQAIVRSIAEYLKGRTCIVVSHRVAPLVDADELVVLENGKVIDIGNHDELMEKSHFYKVIYTQQTTIGMTRGPSDGQEETI